MVGNHSIIASSVIFIFWIGFFSVIGYEDMHVFAYLHFVDIGPLCCLVLVLYIPIIMYVL